MRGWWGQAGFRQICATDTTEGAARIAERWHEAREKRKSALVQLEGTTNFEGLPAFLPCVHRLAAERRLLRNLYLADKDGKERQEASNRGRSGTTHLIPIYVGNRFTLIRGCRPS